MVRKISKHNVHSGNTLKIGNAQVIKEYATQPCIVRNIHGADGNSNLHDAGSLNYDLKGNGVIYSLNKKGRWDLPGLLKNYIHGPSQEEKSAFKVSLLEHHKLNNQSNCISYHANKGKITDFQSKNTYFSGDNIVKQANGLTTRKSRKNRRNILNNENPAPDAEIPAPQVPIVPEVRYEVFYPTPSTSSMLYNPKYIGLNYAEMTENGKSRTSKTKKQRANIRYTNDDMYNDDYDEHEELSDEPDTEGDESYRVHDSNNNIKFEVSLEELLERALKAKDLCADPWVILPATSRNDDVLIKEDWVMVDRPAENPISKRDKGFTVVLQEEHPDVSQHRTGRRQREAKVVEPTSPIEMKSLRILMTNDDVTAERLQDRFADRYIEAACQPRKFLIDITSEASEYAHKSGHDRSPQDLGVWLVFVYDADGQYREGLSIFKVSLNVYVPGVQCSRIETMFEMNMYTLDDVIARTIRYLDIVIPQPSSPCDSIPTTRSPSFRCDNLRSIKQWSVEVHHAAQSHLSVLDKHHLAQGTSQTPVSPWELLPVSELPTYCNICFSLIDPWRLDSEAATGLMSCNHWFCDICWRHHLHAQILNGACELSCPEYDCSALVDPGTALTLLGTHEYRNHLQHVHDTSVETLPEAKWCPNEKCGRVLKISPSSSIADPVCVTCLCGVSMCFLCQKEPHWPAPCLSANLYRNRMRKLGDDLAIEKESEIVVRVKKCPRCRHPIDKNGGCPHMSCRCGHTFCWLCLTAISDHGPSCVPSGNGTHHEKITFTNKITDYVKGQGRSKSYVQAVSHRHARGKNSVKKLNAAKSRLAGRIMLMVSKHPDEICSLLHISPDTDSLTISGEINVVLNNMLLLNSELHFIGENTSVLLDTMSLRTGRQHLQHLIYRLNFISVRIEQILHTSGNQEVKSALTRLTSLKAHANNCMVQLVRVLASIDIHG